VHLDKVVGEKQQLEFFIFYFYLFILMHLDKVVGEKQQPEFF